MEPRIGIIGNRGLLSYTFMAATISDFLHDDFYKTNRKPNPNAHHIKFNRCPRKLKKAIKNSIPKDKIKEFNMFDTHDTVNKLWQYYDETTTIYYLMKGIITQKGKIKPIVKDIRHQVVRIGMY